MIDDALAMDPGGERDRKRIARIAIHRGVQQLERARIAFRIERKNTGHGPEREIPGTEVRIRFPSRAIDLRRAQGWMQGGGDSCGELLVERSGAVERSPGRVRP